MTTASCEAYAAIVDKLPAKRAAVYAYMRLRSVTNLETSQALGWPINVISARVTELVDAGLVKPSGDIRGGQTVWVASMPQEVEALRAARKAARRYETAMVSFQAVGGPEAFGPDQMISVHVQIPRKVWATIKSPVKVRFL